MEAEDRNAEYWELIAELKKNVASMVTLCIGCGTEPNVAALELRAFWSRLPESITARHHSLVTRAFLGLFAVEDGSSYKALKTMLNFYIDTHYPDTRCIKCSWNGDKLYKQCEDCAACSENG